MTVEEQSGDLDEARAALADAAEFGTAVVAGITEVVAVVAKSEEKWSALPGVLGLTAEQWNEAGVEAERERAAHAAAWDGVHQGDAL